MTSKRMHYVRAVFSDAVPAQSRNLQKNLRAALTALPNVADTQCVLNPIGVGTVRFRSVTNNRIQIAIAGGKPGDAMSTFGHVNTATDADQAINPPPARAYKIADAFSSVVDNEVLVCVDGAMRVPSFERYLKSLLQQANVAGNVSAFEFRPVTDLATQEVIDREGVKEIVVHSVARKATQVLAASPAGIVESFKAKLRALFLEAADDDAARQVMSAHFAELQIEMHIKPKGGSRAEPVLLEAMASLAPEFDELPDDAFLTVVTEQGSRIRGSNIKLGGWADIPRQHGRNDLYYQNAWAALINFEADLRQNGYWQQ